MANIEYDIQTSSHSRSTLYLVPNDETIKVYSYSGDGTPMRAFNNLEMALGNFPAKADADSLKDWLKEHESDLVEIAEGFEGEYWDGNGSRGRWSEEAVEAGYRFGEKLDDAYTFEELPTLWEVEDYFEGTADTSILDALVEKSLDDFVQETVNDARMNGICLDADDVRNYVQGILAAEKEG